MDEGWQIESKELGNTMVKIQLGKKTLDLSHSTIIMGILNLSPDSPIKHSIVSPREAVRRAKVLQQEGATIIDVGANSSAARTRDLPVEEEIALVVPIIKQLVKEGLLVSLDSWKPEVAEEAAKAGVHMLNDISGLQNPKMMEVAIGHDLPACVMHMRGLPKRHYKVDQTYVNITEEIYQWFQKRIDELTSAGMKRERIILDPGFEFGKPMKDNLQLLWELHRFHDFQLPLLVSASRKAFIAEAIGLGRTQEGEGLFEATMTVQGIASYLGAHILRVHDVKSAAYVTKFVNTLKSVAVERQLRFPFEIAK